MTEDNGILEENKNWGRRLERIAEENVNSLKWSFSPDSKKEIFSIDTPPPYTSGRPWHLGAAAQYSKIDAIARSQRMLGKEVLFPLGMDRNGIPVERYAEKKYGIRMKDTPREKFIDLCKDSLDELEKEMFEILRSFAYSADFDNIYRTDSEDYRALTQSTFIEMWKKGNIIRGTRPSNYCIDCGTTIADAEIEYKELETKLVYFYFKIKDSDKKILVASTRPELLGACSAILVNPEDERFKDMVNKTAITPIYDKEVKIIAHSYAKAEFGSGAVMICSYGDYNDVMIIKELKLAENVIIDTDGKMNENAGENLKGLKIKDARDKIISMLQENGDVEKIEQIRHRTPMCERSKTPIEIIPLDEYYLKVTEIKDKLEQLANELKMIPEQHKQILINWLKVSTDWPISRRRYYGTEIPLWYCSRCKEPYVPEEGKYYKPWKEKPPEGAVCTKCGGREFVGDDRTFDTWMDSSVSALYVTKYLSDKDFYEKTYPLSLRTQGIDIIRTWLNYSILRCYLLTDKLPWEKAWIDGMGLDEHGEKMSKSKGNGIDPTNVIEKYGADAFRFWAASEAMPGSNFLFSESRIQGSAKFLTKLWNIARLINQFGEQPEMDETQLNESDKWIVSYTEKLTEECRKGYEDLNPFIPANKVREFVWNVFAPHYIELVKARAYGEGFSESEKKSAIYTLNYVLKRILLLLAPITPFITQTLWHELYKDGNVHNQEIPKAKEYDDKLLLLGDKMMEFDSKIWNAKKDKGISLRDGIKTGIPQELKPLEKDLRSMHNIIE
ncbi:MAG: valine--tRNA ligase [Candidatus Parvarchaeum sp.]